MEPTLLLKETRTLLLGKFNKTQATEYIDKYGIYEAVISHLKFIESDICALAENDSSFDEYLIPRSTFVVELYEIVKTMRKRKVSNKKIEERIMPAISEIIMWVLEYDKETLVTRSKNSSSSSADKSSSLLKKYKKEKNTLISTLGKKDWSIQEEKNKKIKIREAHAPKKFLKNDSLSEIRETLKTISDLNDKILSLQHASNSFKSRDVKHNIKILIKDAGVKFTKNLLLTVANDLSTFQKNKNFKKVLQSYFYKVRTFRISTGNSTQ